MQNPLDKEICACEEEENIKFLTKNDLENIKEKIKNLDWYEISNQWVIRYQKDGFSKKQSIILNPYEDCSEKNPLYRHKEWLNYLYTNLELSDPTIGKICNLSGSTIHKWRNILKINAKEFEYRRENSHGYIILLMPPEYRPPYLNYLESDRILRAEHIVVMENYLKENLELSKIYLIDGKYLKPECEVHHINLRRSENGIQNLWVYKNKSEHALSKQSLNNSLNGLIKLGQINFDKGKYYLRDNFDFRMLGRFDIEQMIRPIELINYDDINKVRITLKEINWSEVSDNWIVIYRQSGHPVRSIVLDPYSDCSSENPLYVHKGWVECIVNDKRFNMTDARLGKLCNISETSAYLWRWEKHRITKENYWGKYRTLKKRPSGQSHVYIKLPRESSNPFARKLKRHSTMAEHRYVMEKYLAQHPEWVSYHRYLLDGNYLLPECIVHHVNLDTLDNRIENLWPCENVKEHNLFHNSLIEFVKPLLDSDLLFFEKGKYYLNY